MCEQTKVFAQSWRCQREVRIDSVAWLKHLNKDLSKILFCVQILLNGFIRTKYSKHLFTRSVHKQELSANDDHNDHTKRTVCTQTH